MVCFCASRDDEEVRSSSDSFVGVDVGCKLLAIASDGTQCKTPNMLKNLERQLMYKCNSYIKVDRYYPSSKTCSSCGYHKADLLLGERTFICPSCGLTIDRDLNAALNLLHEGIRIYTEGHSGCACGEAR